MDGHLCINIHVYMFICVQIYTYTYIYLYIYIHIYIPILYTYGAEGVIDLRCCGRECGREDERERELGRKRENNVDSGIKVVRCKGVREKERGGAGGVCTTRQ